MTSFTGGHPRGLDEIRLEVWLLDFTFLFLNLYVRIVEETAATQCL